MIAKNQFNTITEMSNQELFMWSKMFTKDVEQKNYKLITPLTTFKVMEVRTEHCFLPLE